MSSKSPRKENDLGQRLTETRLDSEPTILPHRLTIQFDKGTRLPSRVMSCSLELDHRIFPHVIDALAQGIALVK